MKKPGFTIVAIAFGILLLNSCKKDNKEVDNETQTVVDNAVCEQEFMRIGPSVSERAVSTAGVKKMIPGYAFEVFSTCAVDSLTGDTVADAQGNFNANNLPTLTMDWGAGCTDIDGVFRSGKLVTTFSKSYDSVGCVITITPTNYKVGNIIYSGTIRVTRLAGGNTPSFRTEVLNGHCHTANWDIDFLTDKTITYQQGYNTPGDPSDDIIQITGNSSGKNREGRTFTVAVKTPLVKKASCKWIQQGTVDITPDGLKTRTVDFGSGSCDNTGTFTVNGNTYTFTMQ
ncbi:MAG: lipoprotein precursor [Bacteroidetes bacterium]|jgi:hypothetical protein|nr:lipoprotein precursor [Bacteroidota bacterium]